MKKILLITLMVILFCIPVDAVGSIQKGKCSYYDDYFHGKITAFGGRFSQYELVGAHRTLPPGTRVQVKNLKNKKVVTVKIVDRGPYIPGRVIDLSKEAFKRIASLDEGVVEVKIHILS